ncbi:MAG: heat shock protein HtpX [Actinomycetota bacterium]|nr:heat shock protein HtpX [Actinomycetota bacterium]
MQSPSAWPLIWTLPAAVAGGVGWALAGPAGGVLAGGAAAVGSWLWIRSQGMLALRSAGAIPSERHRAARLHNLVEGLASGATPSIWVIPKGEPNAFICRSRVPVIAVTQSLLDGYTRTELEAVVAHCVVRLPELNRLSRAVALGSVGMKTVARVGFSQDAAAVAVTLYPPALARAIEKARPRGGRFSALWFAGDEHSHQPQSARVQRLSEL